MDKIYVISDINVTSYARRLYPGMPLLEIEVSEESKTVQTVLGICSWLLENGADRDAILVSVGGGCTSDIAGFAASIYKRGIRYAICPTTILSMADASIGGKTGVNFMSYKNMIGTFHQPYFIKPVYEALDTLPRKEYLSGIAEILKTFLIGDSRLYEDAVKAIREGESIRPFIQAAARIKHEIVDSDLRERGDRRKLNLGHTVGHAIEWWQTRNGTRSYTHGEAVSIGIVQAAKISEERGIANPGLTQKIKSDFKACGLPTELPCPLEELLPAIEKDKKASEGKVRWVLIRKPGKVEIRAI